MSSRAPYIYSLILLDSWLGRPLATHVFKPPSSCSHYLDLKEMGDSLPSKARKLLPWEHHATVINLPRYNYSAASTNPSLVGFLVTCSFDREKSATKEAMSIFKEYLKNPIFGEDQDLRDFNANTLLKESAGEEAGRLLYDRSGKRARQEDLYIKGGHTCAHDSHGPSTELNLNVEDMESMSSKDNSSIPAMLKEEAPMVKEEVPEKEVKERTGAVFSGEGVADREIGGSSTDPDLKVVRNGDVKILSSVRSSFVPPMVKEVEAEKEAKQEGEGAAAVDVSSKDSQLLSYVENSSVPSVVEEKKMGKTFKEEDTQSGAVDLKGVRAADRETCAYDLYGLFILKMAQKGIIFIFLSDGSSDDPVDVLSKILWDIENGVRNPPQWCQRIVPVQATCPLLKESLSIVVVKLVKQHLRESTPKQECPLKYAVGYNRRGIEARAKDEPKSMQEPEMLGRMDCIHAVVEAVEKAAIYTAVDLAVPQMVVLVEVLPLAGLQGSPVCAVAVLSGDMVNVKPKLCIKPLIPSSHPSKKRK